MCSLLCSTDVIAAVSIIKFDKQPKLFCLIFGEGILNDAVCIILFNTVLKFTKSSAEFDSSAPFVIIEDFLFLGVMSLLTGIVFAFICALLLKKARMLTSSAINETLVIFIFGYLSYTFAEFFHFSGIISLLTSGVVLAHYAWYNLSPQGKKVTTTCFQFIGLGCEAFCFTQLGLTFFSYSSFEWSAQLFFVMFFIIVVGRFLGSVVFLQILRLFCHKP